MPLLFLAMGATLLAGAARSWPNIAAHHGALSFTWPYACPEPNRIRFRPEARGPAEARAAAFIAANGPWWTGGGSAARFPPDLVTAIGPQTDPFGRVVGAPALYVRSEVALARCEDLAATLDFGAAGAAALAIALLLGRERTRDALGRLGIACFLGGLARPPATPWAVGRKLFRFYALGVLLSLPGIVVSRLCEEPPLTYLGFPLLTLGPAAFLGFVGALAMGIRLAEAPAPAAERDPA
jgi:hypothetical protein